MTKRGKSRKSRKRYKRPEGYITLFLTLVLGLCLSLFLTLVEGARRSSIRTAASVAVDVAGQSCLAEYNRALLDQYDLFYIDTSYGKQGGGDAATGKHLLEYLRYNLDLSGMEYLVFPRDVLGMRAMDVNITAAGYATDGKASNLSRQILTYVKDLDGISIAERITSPRDKYNGRGFAGENVDGRWSENQRRLDSIEKPRFINDNGDEEEMALENPADHVSGMRSSGLAGNAILGQVGAGNGISTAVIAASMTFSTGRSSWGINPDRYAAGGASALDPVLLQQYILAKTGNYRNTLDKSALKYQQEYILNGKKSDRDNLAETLKKLVMLREAANVAYIFSDGGKRGEAEAMAAIIAIVVAQPQFIEPLTNIILLAWSYVESISDVKNLINGGKVALTKSAATWRTGLRSALIGNVPGNVTMDSGGFDYEQYVTMLLMTMSKEKKVSRLMDIMEMDVRLVPGNEYFMLENCADHLEFLADVGSASGYSCSFFRKYSYEPDYDSD